MQRFLDPAELASLATYLSLSRVLRALVDEGLVEVVLSATDGRVRVARLTAAGAQERRHLDTRSDAAASAVLEPLDPSQRSRLLTAMAETERLLQATMVEVDPADPRSPEAQHCLAACFTELAGRFDTGFDLARSLPATEDELVPPAGVLLVARLHARARHVRTLRLETNRTLEEAVRLYRSAGYSEVPAFNDEPFAHHWFENTSRRPTPEPRATASPSRSTWRTGPCDRPAVGEANSASWACSGKVPT